MAKVKTAYFCQNCGHESPQWIGKCPSCNEWNTFAQEIVQKQDKSNPIANSKRVNKSQKVGEIQFSDEIRIALQDSELNRVLGGGLVPGSLILFGGEPGIGKSTLMLQLALQNQHKRILYVSGEESYRQIKMRADRIDFKNENCFILNETNTQNIFAQIEEIQPEILIIDSIQTLQTQYIESAPGSVSQIRECSAELMKFAKESQVAVFLIGHITKDGAIAGPKVLEHMVDTVLYFEGERNHVYRILRSTKNRFGSTNELGIYEMSSFGLREVANPSEVLVNQSDEEMSGVAIAVTIEGMRAFLIEIQALVSTAVYGTPQRATTGFDMRRLNMLLAVLEKRCGFRLAAKDVFLNITGGIKVDDPSIDLAVVCSVLSSSADISIPLKYCFAAEVGLSGEIRPVSHIEQRINEAQKLGYEKIVISKFNKGVEQKNYHIEIIKVSKIEQVFRALFA